jgi:hypothetical protein
VIRGRGLGSMRSRSLPPRSLWTGSAENLPIVFGQGYSSSTRYGAGLKEALRATLMLGLACVPSCCNALSTTKLRALSNEAGTRMALQWLQSVYQLLRSLVDRLKDKRDHAV